MGSIPSSDITKYTSSDYYSDIGYDSKSFITATTNSKIVTKKRARNTQSKGKSDTHKGER
jgi:hypothetical protein